MAAQQEPGRIGWVDLTVPDAPRIRDFYQQVVGWRPQPHPMGEYDDYTMLAPSGLPAAGVCHARGVNAGLPAAWLVYITVDDLANSVRRCRDLGGEVIVAERDLGSGLLAIIRDPAGAACALWQPRTTP